uniref:HugZ family pyridoxamine 5'-phosphate oxidase n=1 Tax=Ningiella ruwaisensis TaxID=2364274 RepID=UPI0010A0801F|nr:DUF2470 domain-containing protein [Ningiella ruwaisensis]
MTSKLQHIQQARALMRAQHSGVLSTNSLSMKGFPFGSVTPFLMSESGDLIIYASDIAQHSRNMKNDSHVSLCVHDANEQDSQASARVTVLARAVADEVSKELQHQYFSLFPQAKKYVQAHDFRFYLLKTERVRYIGGFGDIFWFSQTDWKSAAPTLQTQVKGVISHMHDDHADALVAIAKAHLQNSFSNTKDNHPQLLENAEEESAAEMLSCFAEGFHIAYLKHICFIPFLHQISENYDLRRAMVDLTKRARQEELV